MCTDISTYQKISLKTFKAIISLFIFKDTTKFKVLYLHNLNGVRFKWKGLCLHVHKRLHFEIGKTSKPYRFPRNKHTEACTNGYSRMSNLRVFWRKCSNTFINWDYSTCIPIVESREVFLCRLTTKRTLTVKFNNILNFWYEWKNNNYCTILKLSVEYNLSQNRQ